MASGASGGGMADGGAAGFTAEATLVVLEEACATVGLDPAGARLLRLGSNAIYDLAGLRVIVRIAADPDSLAEMERAIRVARWLAAEGFPANRVVADVAQPLVVGGRVVTFWESVQDDEEYASVTELADLLKRLHWLEEPEPLELPYFDPFAKVCASLRGLGAGVQPEDVKFLAERADRLEKDYGRLDFVLPFGLIHGDANIGNILRDRSAARC
ncbi:phosphotransferase [Streptomyces sp. NPDC087270]|uniref:phosphotransferase n=1 Tax=Streptomyces sp. NPDC087270 TaxID=3365774 RepID=UPI00380797A7